MLLFVQMAFDMNVIPLQFLMSTALALALTNAAQAQDVPSTSAPPTEPAVREAAPKQERTNGDPQAIFRAPLLREGSAVIDVRASISRDPKRGWWIVTLPSTRSALPANELALMPCTRLSEMQRIVEASPNRRIEFQISGRVFVFRGRNYLLPTYAPVVEETEVTEAAAPDAASTPPVESSAEPAANPASDAATTSSSEGDSVADIMRELEQASGPLTQNPASMAQGSPQPPPLAALPDTAAPITPGGSVTARPGESVIAEETSIVNRRGKITRDSSGGWLFVLDADTTGLADPPMRLQPCLLLERIEDYARRQGNNSPALLSGTMYLYNGRNYLMPTVFRIPQERRNLSP